jgi:hypothetical protein
MSGLVNDRNMTLTFSRKSKFRCFAETEFQPKPKSRQKFHFRPKLIKNVSYKAENSTQIGKKNANRDKLHEERKNGPETLV